MGCLYQQYMNNMVPGIPGNDSSASAPVAEYNKKLTITDITNTTITAQLSTTAYEVTSSGLISPVAWGTGAGEYSHIRVVLVG